MKEKAKTRRKLTSDRLGDAYCFTAFERDTKLILTWHLGRRTETDTATFIEKVYEAVEGTTNIIQITTDGFNPYPNAIAYSLGTRSSYAQLVKIYGQPLDAEDQHRYSPSKIKEVIPTPLWGNPNPERICTSHVERQNLNIRTAMRRFTRLTNGFSKKWENQKAALALYFAYYQLLPDSHFDPMHSRNGSGNNQQRLEHQRFTRGLVFSLCAAPRMRLRCARQFHEK